MLLHRTPTYKYTAQMAKDISIQSVCQGGTKRMQTICINMFVSDWCITILAHSWWVSILSEEETDSSAVRCASDRPFAK